VYAASAEGDGIQTKGGGGGGRRRDGPTGGKKRKGRMVEGKGGERERERERRRSKRGKKGREERRGKGRERGKEGHRRKVTVPLYRFLKSESTSVTQFFRFFRSTFFWLF
jgi:hypothetical protein